jgi:hypothetical protein
VLRDCNETTWKFKNKASLNTFSGEVQVPEFLKQSNVHQDQEQAIHAVFDGNGKNPDS